MVVVIVVAVLEWRRRRRVLKIAALLAVRLSPEPLQISAEPDLPISFGRKNHWIAAPTESSAAVATVLGLCDVEACNWHSGFVAAYAYPNDRVFVTPPLNGWVLAVGTGLPDPSDPALLPAWRALLARASQLFGQAYFFASHRGSSYSAWARYRNGNEERLFAFADETIHNVGLPSAEEQEIIARLPDPSLAENDPDYRERDDFRPPDEADVFRLASAWSIDPSTLEDEGLGPSAGLTGRLFPERVHLNVQA